MHQVRKSVYLVLTDGGDGEWMRNWVARMEEAGAQVYGGEDAICMNEPDSEAEAKLEALGKRISSIIKFIFPLTQTHFY